MTRRRFQASLLLSEPEHCVPARATAAPLMIDSGCVTITGVSNDDMDFQFSGDGFFLQGRGLDFGFGGPNGCFPCVAGDSISFDSEFVVVGEGQAQFGGVDYPDVPDISRNAVVLSTLCEEE